MNGEKWLCPASNAISCLIYYDWIWKKLAEKNKKTPPPGFEPRIPEGQVLFMAGRRPALYCIFIRNASRPAHYRVMRRWHRTAVSRPETRVSRYATVALSNGASKTRSRFKDATAALEKVIFGCFIKF